MWAFCARMALTRKDLLEHVEIKSEQAVQRDDPRWKAEDMKALAVLVKMLSPTYQSMVRECKTANEAWETLKNFFSKKNLHNRVQLRKELHEFSMESGANLMEHLLRFDELCLKLSAAGDNVNEDEKMAILLGSLPSEYDAMRSRQQHNEEVVKEAVVDVAEAEVAAGVVEEVVTSLANALGVDMEVDTVEPHEQHRSAVVPIEGERREIQGIGTPAILRQHTPQNVEHRSSTNALMPRERTSQITASSATPCGTPTSSVHRIQHAAHGETALVPQNMR
ncbi:hypothetical protein Plhal304r1_c092g0172081 [Plasmopara halstedii]